MGKIFTALEKYRRERGGIGSTRLKDSDYELLLRFDETTGRLETDAPLATGHSGSFKRLMTYRLVDSSGRLTPAGRAKHRELRRAFEAREPERSAKAGRPEQPVLQATRVSKNDKLSASDWAILMKYDRKSGNLLTYDAAAGRLDRNSSAILKDPAIIQRLIDSGMIMPGGWLTPQAKRECARIEQKLKTKQIKGFAKQGKSALADKAARQTETLRQADLDVLLQSDPKTRKLDLNNQAVAKDPGIVRRLVANKMVLPDGKLTAKGLLNWQVLTRWSPDGDEKGSDFGGEKPAAAGKLSAAADTRPKATSPAASGQNEVKITSLEEEDEPAVIKKAQEVRVKDLSPPAHPKAPAEPEPKRPRAKDNSRRPERAVRAAGSPRTNVTGRFALKKTGTEYDRNAMDKNLVSLFNPESFEAEQFKILRTNLLFPASGEAPRSIMVTSALPGEGKSFVAANLAVSVARHINRRVLLIDCDLRRPSIHRQFGFGDTPGLSDYLSRGVDLASLLLKTGVEHLTLLPAGRATSTPSELLSSNRMSDLIKEVSARYRDRLIIIDSPPPRMAAESGALARQVDGILLVVKYAGTPREMVTDLIDKLGPDKVLGAIVNNFELMSPYYARKYYTYYGKSYRQK